MEDEKDEEYEEDEEDEEDALSPLSQTFLNHKENNKPIHLSNKLLTPQTDRNQKHNSSSNITLTTPSKGNTINKPNDKPNDKPKHNISNDKPKTIEVIKEPTPINI